MHKALVPKTSASTNSATLANPSTNCSIPAGIAACFFFTDMNSLICYLIIHILLPVKEDSIWNRPNESSSIEILS